MTLKILSICLFYGGVAGIVSALTLLLMTGLQHHLWALGSGPLFIFATVMVGGLLIAALSGNQRLSSLNQVIEEASNPTPLRARKTAILAASAIIAVAFGASIGPEAGLIAVVSELSILVGSIIARSQEKAGMLATAGQAAALAGVYGSPAGAASFDDDTLSPSKLASFLAATSGFLLFATTMKLLGSEHQALELPIAPRGDIATWWQAIPAALLGSAVALIFLKLHHLTDALIHKIARPRLQVLVGSLLLASLLAAVPLLRFSGHAELGALVTLLESSSWLTLTALALLKALATAISLSSGWTGGEFFPLVFAGASAGAASLAFIPGADPGTALTAGMVAAATLALNKPLTVVLIMVFLLPGTALGPLLVAALIATILSKALQ